MLPDCGGFPGAIFVRLRCGGIRSPPPWRPRKARPFPHPLTDARAKTWYRLRQALCGRPWHGDSETRDPGGRNAAAGGLRQHPGLPGVDGHGNHGDRRLR
ncbi:protein of unknown function (plasmid) [Azospirillum baldaniorum]|uniref:Uncharacterized protein n=1 Tax=Azospirillum baldaniorum TaxID=1064539 RepID=A0A9P1JUK8_9PROT|nr:protein of unknown function [Azospirillum baldaniorum]